LQFLRLRKAVVLILREWLSRHCDLSFRFNGKPNRKIGNFRDRLDRGDGEIWLRRVRPDPISAPGKPTDMRTRQDGSYSSRSFPIDLVTNVDGCAEIRSTPFLTKLLTIFPRVSGKQAKETFMRLIQQFLRDERATTAIEYALIGTLIAVVIIGAVRSVGSAIQAKFFGPIANNLN
jgi:pilus assembly protein Flp/PilA